MGYIDKTDQINGEQRICRYAGMGKMDLTRDCGGKRN